MRRFWAVAAREVGEWRLALFAAPILGLVPLVAPYLPGTNAGPRNDFRMAMLIVLLAAFEGLFILFLGSGLVSREAREGRLGFYFSRPIPGPTLWLGKLSGALVLVFGSGLLIVLPTLGVTRAEIVELDVTGVAYGGGFLGYLEHDAPDWSLLAPQESAWLQAFEPEGLPERSGWTTAGAWFLASLLVIVAVHVLNVLARQRNAWLLLDLVALAVALALGWAAVDKLVSAQALGPLIWAERVLLVVISAGAVTAAGVALAAGRCDADRSRRILSTTLWGVVLAAAVGFLGFAHRSLAVDSGDLVAWYPEPTPDGEWILISGPTRGRDGYRAAFLRHVRSEKEVALGPAAMARFHLTTSLDGSTAVYLRCRRLAKADCELMALRLDAEQSRPRATGIPASPWRHVTLSADGRRVALVNHLSWSLNEVAVYDVEFGRIVTAVRVGYVVVSEFLDDGRLRLYTSVRGRASDLEIQELLPASRKLVRTGVIPDFQGELLLHPETDVVFQVAFGPEGLEAYRGDTGELLARHAEFTYGMDRIRFLADGRTVVPGRDDEGPALFILAADGSVERRVGTRRPALLGAEIVPGRLVVLLRAGNFWDLDLLDVASGELERRGRGLQPLADQKTRPCSMAARLLWDGHEIVLWDEESGEMRPVLEMAAPMRGMSVERRFPF